VAGYHPSLQACTPATSFPKQPYRPTFEACVTASTPASIPSCGESSTGRSALSNTHSRTAGLRPHCRASWCWSVHRERYAEAMTRAEQRNRDAAVGHRERNEVPVERRGRRAVQVVVGREDGA
jgi:hypothetical protein